MIPPSTFFGRSFKWGRSDPYFFIFLIAVTANANSFEGVYEVDGAKETVTIKKISDEQYSVSRTTWEGKATVSKGMVFWDKHDLRYEGVFQYLGGFHPGGMNYRTRRKSENAVGYYQLKVGKKGEITVTMQWGYPKKKMESMYIQYARNNNKENWGDDGL